MMWIAAGLVVTMVGIVLVLTPALVRMADDRGDPYGFVEEEDEDA